MMSQRFLRVAPTFVVVAVFAAAQVDAAEPSAKPAAAARPNVLLLMADDLAATLACYGHPYAQTPNLDALAARGVLFRGAYCQFPHCNPSRSSMLSGLRPGTTRVTNNEDNLYTNIPDVLTLPHHFRKHGYATARCGKIFHLGVPTGLESMDDPQAWEFGTPFRSELPYPKKRASVVDVATKKGQGLGWQEIPGDDDQLCDGDFAQTAVAWLKKRDPSRPFFLAVGFHRPHTPLVAPAKYFDRYSFDAIRLPDAPADDEADIPPPARNGAVPGYTLSTTPEQRRAAIRAYLACVSYVDAQAGRILQALDELQLRDNTIVIFTSDHGWHLGEHGLWHKRSLFEESARVPFILHAPGMPANGQECDGLIELLDVYPTLCDLCDVPTPKHLQGASLRTLLHDPKHSLHEGAFTQARRGAQAEHWGRSIRTARYRCTQWDEGRAGTELYDHATDPHEYTNLADDPAHAAELARLTKLLADRFADVPAAK
ncbi:MAG: iduronate-2-sulfatase [Pirellula sp.]|nr:iduronate-2-sulfatase [Pirellula sp.]